MDALAFEGALLQFIQRLCEQDGLAVTLTRDTPLFAARLVDSKRVIDVMDYVERLLQITIPDNKLSMQHFRSVAIIAETFAGGVAPEASPESAGGPIHASPSGAAEPALEAPLQAFGRADARPDRRGLDAMVERGEVMANASGCVAFSGVALDLHAYFRRLFATLAVREAASSRRYPTLLPLTDMQRTDYFKSFPQHATFCTCLDHDERTLQHFVRDVKAGGAVSEAAAPRLEAPAMVLSSAVCYHCFREFAGRCLEPGITTVTAEGRCFRHERGAFQPLDRQYEFTMREIILLGDDPAALVARRDRLKAQVVHFAELLGLSGTVEPATDMFFGGDVSGRARALHQRAMALKLELRVRMDDTGRSLAVASFNLHEDYFGRSFDIRGADGAPAHTGCVAFGIERWVSAFLAYHGADLEAWPRAVREHCGRFANPARSGVCA